MGRRDRSRPVPVTYKKDNPNEKLHREAAAFSSAYQIPEAVAFQVVRGDFTLKEWAEKHAQAEVKRVEREHLEAARKKRRSRDEGLGQQYFLKQKKKEIPLGMALIDGSRHEGLIVSILPYHFWLEIHGATQERLKLEKLQIAYCYKAENRDQLGGLISRDQRLAAQDLTPSRDRNQRYVLPLELLGRAAEQGRSLQATLLDGTVLHGTIDWLSSHFIKLKLAEEISVVIFVHALHEIVAAKPAAPHPG